MLRKAITRHVHCAGIIDAVIDLGFKISVERTLKLSGVDFPFLVDRSQDSKESQNAKHCLIVLLGGKSILLEIDDEDSKRLTCKIYLPVPNIPEGPHVSKLTEGPHLYVNTYMTDLATRQFPVEEVKNLLNRRRS